MSLYDIKKKLEILELFEKSTNAMKLVSLSLYHRLKKDILDYNIKFNNNLLAIKDYFDLKVIIEKDLYIFVSSDRGFCGDYVNNMFYEFEKIYKIYPLKKYLIVGKMLMNKIQASGYDTKNITLLSIFKINTISILYDEIVLFLKNNDIKIIHVYYTEAKNISNRFILNYYLNINYNDYQIKKNFSIGFSNVSDIICPFIDFTLKSLLYNILNQSLFAEQGARFIAMDAALKNTRDSIEKNKKLYFKVRQQKINTQLQDLVASLL